MWQVKTNEACRTNMARRSSRSERTLSGLSLFGVAERSSGSQHWKTKHNESADTMTRRKFLKASGTGAVALAAATKTNLFAAEEDKPLRVALIGCGWYGKTDLFHLIQVAPVEV